MDLNLLEEISKLYTMRGGKFLPEDYERFKWVDPKTERLRSRLKPLDLIDEKSTELSKPNVVVEQFADDAQE